MPTGFEYYFHIRIFEYLNIRLQPGRSTTDLFVDYNNTVHLLTLNASKS